MDTNLLLIATAAVLLILLILLFFRPKKRLQALRIDFKADPLGDTFEVVDYKTPLKVGKKSKKNFDDDSESQILGKTRTSYLVWRKEFSRLKFKGKIRTEKDSPLPKGQRLLLELDERRMVKPEDMRVHIEEDDFVEPNYDYDALEVQVDENGRFEFWVKLSYAEQFQSSYAKPRFVRLAFRAWLAGDERASEYIYPLHIGPPLGEMWIGIDPGTTATCIAATNAEHEHAEIVLAQRDGKDVIEPSRIAFDKRSLVVQNLNGIAHETDQEQVQTIYSHNREALDNNVPNPIFDTGEYARMFGTENGVSFQSIKKLLGYKGKMLVPFEHHPVPLELSGVQLASLMVKNMYTEFESYLRKNQDRLPLLTNGQADFHPLKAVVAIPNTFTAAQTQDMVDSIFAITNEEGRSQFAEVKTIYEAEAVLMYCLENHLADFQQGTVLIFDMGGATINANLVGVKKNGLRYKIRIFDKIGYAVGGDSIDWCLAKLLFSFAGEYKELKGIDLFANTEDMSPAEKKEQIDLRIRFKEKVLLPWKKLMVENFQQGATHLLPPTDARTISGETELIRMLGLNRATVDAKYGSKFLEHFYAQFELDEESEKYPAFSFASFEQYIYRSVRDAVTEILSDYPDPIHHVIFSGRSTGFPYIQEQVLNTLTENGLAEISTLVLAGDEAKTAVAKGACIFGWYSSRVELVNDRIYYTYGVSHTVGLGNDIEFFKLIPSGARFSDKKWKAEWGRYLQAKKQAAQGIDFSTERGRQIRFYRVSGKNPENIIGREDMKHRYSCIASFRAEQMVKELRMQVDERDVVRCGVVFNDGQKRINQQQITEQSLAAEHEEHYLWLVQ